jgi:hypothetical protein
MLMKMASMHTRLAVEVDDTLPATTRRKFDKISTVDKPEPAYKASVVESEPGRCIFPKSFFLTC